MNEAMKRLRRAQSSGKSLTGAVVCICRNDDGPDRVILDYAGCQVIVPASADATRYQLDRLLGMDIDFFVAGVAPEDSIAIGYCCISPREWSSQPRGESHDQQPALVHKEV